MIAIPTPTPEAAIRPMVRATMMTASTTAKSKTVARDSIKRSGSRSIMRMPMTIRMPASAATGTQARNEPKTSAATSDSNPSRTPETRVLAPLFRLTSVAPMVPAPGIPPTADEAMLAIPCATSSRSGWCRVRVNWSMTTQVFRVSIESRAARVSALPSRPAI